MYSPITFNLMFPIIVHNKYHPIHFIIVHGLTLSVIYGIKINLVFHLAVSHLSIIYFQVSIRASRFFCYHINRMCMVMIGGLAGGFLGHRGHKPLSYTTNTSPIIWISKYVSIVRLSTVLDHVCMQVSIAY